MKVQPFLLNATFLSELFYTPPPFDLFLHDSVFLLSLFGIAPKSNQKALGPAHRSAGGAGANAQGPLLQVSVIHFIYS